MMAETVTENRDSVPTVGSWNTEQQSTGTENTEIALNKVESVVSTGNYRGGAATRFQKGNPGGPGRKRLSMEDRAIRLMDLETSDEDIRQVWRKVIEGALLGHTKKMELFITQTAGTPTQRTQAIGNAFQDILALLVDTSTD